MPGLNSGLIHPDAMDIDAQPAPSIRTSGPSADDDREEPVDPSESVSTEGLSDVARVYPEVNRVMDNIFKVLLFSRFTVSPFLLYISFSQYYVIGS